MRFRSKDRRSETVGRRETCEGVPPMSRVRIRLGDRSYDIMVGAGITPQALRDLPALGSKNAYVIADKRLTRARSSLLRALKKNGWRVQEIPVNAGEGLKDWK